MRLKLFFSIALALLLTTTLVYGQIDHGGTMDKITNLTAICPEGNFQIGAYLDVTILDAAGAPDQTVIDFPSGIDSSSGGPIFTAAEKRIGIQFNQVQPLGTTYALLLYTDNKDPGAGYQYTGTGESTGLIGASGVHNAPVIYSLYDTMRKDCTNYGGGYNETPLLPTTWDPGNAADDNFAWTNIQGSDCDGYFKYMSDVQNPGYTWDGNGKYETMLVSNMTNDVDWEQGFHHADCSPVKGDKDSTTAWSDEGEWIKFTSPFGGFWVDDMYDASWNYQGPGAGDGNSDCFVYLAAGFQGKPIQEYKTSKIIVEVYHKP